MRALREVASIKLPKVPLQSQPLQNALAQRA